MLNVFLGSIFSHFPLVPSSMAVSCPTSPPNSTWWVGGGGGEKPDAGFRVERWSGPPAKLTLLLFTYLVHAYGHGQGSKVQNWAREKGGGASLIWGAKRMSDMGGGGKGLSWGAWGVGGWG